MALFHGRVRIPAAANAINPVLHMEIGRALHHLGCGNVYRSCRDEAIAITEDVKAAAGTQEHNVGAFRLNLVCDAGLKGDIYSFGIFRGEVDIIGRIAPSAY